MAKVLPPHNSDAESSVLGAILLSREARDAVLDSLAPEDFYRPAHAHVFAAIRALDTAGETIDAITVAEEINRAGLLDEIGGPATILEIQSSPPTIAGAEKYAKIVLELSARRKVVSISGDAREAALSGDVPLDSILGDLEDGLTSLSGTKGGANLTQVGESAPSIWSAAKRALESSGGLLGVTTGFPRLDSLTSGFQPGQLVILGARPSMGKSSLALSITKAVGIDEGRPVLFFSLEMSRDELMTRLLSQVAMVPSRNIMSGNLMEPDWFALEEGLNIIQDSGTIWVDDTAGLTVADMRSAARSFKRRHGDLGLVVVDYLQLAVGGMADQNLEVGEASRNFKILAREIEAPVLALSQLSRTLEHRQDKRPMLSDLRSSGSLEQDADIVMFVYRDEKYVEESEWRGTAEISIAKQRNGPTGMVRLAYLDHYTRFASLS